MDFSRPRQVIQLKYESRQWVGTVLNSPSEPLEKEERLPEALVSELKPVMPGHFILRRVPKKFGRF